MAIWMRWLAWSLIALLAAAAAAVTAGVLLAERRMQRRVDVRPWPVALRSDGRAIERGHYLYASRGCVDCHGANGAGRTFVDDGQGLHIAGPNISPGPGSVVTGYAADDWVRTLRHGVGPGGRALRVMPSEDYNRLTDDDVASLVAYVRSLPPAAGRGAVVELPLPLRVLYGYGLIPDAASKIDHHLAPARPVAEGVSIEHGRYVAGMCVGCHGTALAGGRIAGGPPDWPPAADLRPGAGRALARYPDADSLLQLFRSGRRSDGSAVRVMPFESLREMNDVDARALHLYLKSLPAAAG